ncbi:hypothetical protein [Bradyrhizobium sp. USDA 4449]
MALLAVLAALSTASPTLAESAYPTPTHDGRERIQRTGTCPTGFVGKGAFCEALHQDTPHAFPVMGKTCPSGTFRSGDACKAFR